MTRNKRIGRRIWWGLLVLWILCFGVGVFFLFGRYCLAGVPSFFSSYFMFIFDDIESENLGIWSIPIIYLGLFIFTQWLFLSSKKHWNVKTQKTGRPMKRAAIGVAFASSLLSMALIFSICDLISDAPFEEGPNFITLSISPVQWVIWSIIFSIYFYQKDYLKWSGKIIRGLIGGSILELFISIPIFFTREDECYCARGSYAGIVFGVTVLLWAFGPGIFLLYWREKKRLEEGDSSENSQ